MPTTYGVYPEAHELIEDAQQRTLTVRNRFYSVTHSLNHGGAIVDIRLHKGTGRNLLLGPCASEVAFSDGGACSEVYDAHPTPTVQREGDDLILTFEGKFRDSDGNPSNVEYRHTYRHRWGHIKIEKRLRFADGTRVSRLCVHSWQVQPELTHFGIRPAAPVEASSWSGAFGVCQWGRFSPGAAFDSAYESRFVPRYVCCADPGREGLEWFVGSDLAQWDYQLTGAPGHGSFNLSAQTRPPGVGMSVCPLNVRSGAVLSGDVTFNFYLGIPIISGQANRLFLHKSFNRQHFPSDPQLAAYADAGVGSIHFHHDGDSFRDGRFWRDGSYPPFGPDDMKEYDRVIRDCHRHGIRVATYFSNKELHPSVEAYQQHGAEWARLPDDSWEQLHNAYSGDEYGAQMCLRSGWADFHKEYIDKVLSHHDLDGTYYDWNVSLYCHNARHVEGHKGDPMEPGVGGWAFSPAGHWDMDELLDLVAWTRRRVGPDGLMILHNTMVPMAATENYADSIVAMEWGYTKLASDAPALDDLPLEWSFMGHRSRGVIGYGCLEKDAPDRVHRAMTLRALLTGVAPWPADDMATTMYAPLAGRDLSRYRFAEARSGAVATGDADIAAAVYHQPDEAVVLVGNLAAGDRSVRCRIDPARLDLRAAPEYLIRTSGDQWVMSATDLAEAGPELTLKGDDVVTFALTPRPV